MKNKLAVSTSDFFFRILVLYYRHIILAVCFCSKSIKCDLHLLNRLLVYKQSWLKQISSFFVVLMLQFIKISFTYKSKKRIEKNWCCAATFFFTRENTSLFNPSSHSLFYCPAKISTFNMPADTCGIWGIRFIFQFNLMMHFLRCHCLRRVVVVFRCCKYVFSYYFNRVQ